MLSLLEKYKPCIRELSYSDIGKEIIRIGYIQDNKNWIGDIMVLIELNKVCSVCGSNINTYTYECGEICMKELETRFICREKFQLFGFDIKINDEGTYGWALLNDIKNMGFIEPYTDNLNPFLGLTFPIIDEPDVDGIDNLKQMIKKLKDNKITYTDNIGNNILKRYFHGQLTDNDIYDKLKLNIKSKTPDWVIKLSKCIDIETKKSNDCCIICRENKKKICAVPCGHISTCSKCSLLIYEHKKLKCPICRFDIREMIEVYFS